MAAGNITEVIESMHIDAAGDEKYHLKIGTKLSKKEYRSINSLLNAFGGRWHTGVQAHIFDYDPTERLLEVAKSGVMPKLNPHAFFPTPLETCIGLLDDEIFGFFKHLLGNQTEDFRILEPSAGSGNFLDAAREVFGIGDLEYFNRITDCVEYDINNIKTLKAKGYEPVHGDFLAFNTDYKERYDLILCNPPFSVDGDKKAYITHIEHAHKMLKPGGVMLFIAPTGFLTNRDKRTLAFCDMLSKHYMESRELERGTFAQSGTNVATAAVYLSGSQRWGGMPFNGYEDVFVWRIVMSTDHDERFYPEFEKMIKKGRSSRSEIREFVRDILNTTRKEYIFTPYSKMDSYITALLEIMNCRIEEMREEEEEEWADACMDTHSDSDAGADIWNKSEEIRITEDSPESGNVSDQPKQLVFAF